MTAFFADLSVNPFLLTGLLAGGMASIACGVVGPYVLNRRLVFLTGAIAHIALGGIGGAIYAAHRWPGVFASLSPLVGGLVASVFAALLLAWLHQRVQQRLDTVIGALWALGMALGLLLVKLTPGYQTELMSYLFGNLALVSPRDVVLLGVLNLGIVGTALLFHKRFLALSLDVEQAELQGVSRLATDAVLLVLVALTVITLAQVVGLILVIALVTLPAATASHHASRLAGVMALAIGLSVLLTTAPRILVYGSAIPPEPAIVLAAAGLYLLSLLLSSRRTQR